MIEKKAPRVGVKMRVLVGGCIESAGVIRRCVPLEVKTEKHAVSHIAGVFFFNSPRHHVKNVAMVGDLTPPHPPTGGLLHLSPN